MSDRFVSSSMRQKKISFKVQIGDYSRYVCKGHYTSPGFGDFESNFSLLVHVYDGADHENFIDVRLRRDNYTKEEQFVNSKMSIVNCLGLRMFKSESNVLFGYSDEARILAVAKADLKGFCGLKKQFCLPNDTLTLQCDLVVHENNVFPYENEKRFLNSASPRDRTGPSEYFAHSRLIEENSDFFSRKIHNFSVYTYGGRTIGPEYRSQRLGGKWNLVVCAAHDAEILDIRLMREESYEHQLIKVKLSIIDNYGKVTVCKEKNAYFTSSREVQLISLTDKDTSSLFGLYKKRLTPDDTLTLRCDMVLCKQVDDEFRSRYDFHKSIMARRFAPAKIIPYLLGLCFVLGVLLHLLYILCFAIVPYIWNTALYIYEIMKLFVAAVIGISLLFIYIKHKAEKIEREEEIREFKRKLRHEKMKKIMNEYKKCNNNYSKNKSDYYRKPTYYNQRYYNYK